MRRDLFVIIILAIALVGAIAYYILGAVQLAVITLTVWLVAVGALIYNKIKFGKK